MRHSNDITPFRPQPCPYCTKTVDAAGSADGIPFGPPNPGDFLICFGCTQPSVWVDGPLGGGLRAATPEELAEFAVDHAHHVDLLQEFHRQHGR